MERKPGFYWVKQKGYDWAVAEYINIGDGGWYLTCDYKLYPDDYFIEIDEHIIEKREYVTQQVFIRREWEDVFKAYTESNFLDFVSFAKHYFTNGVIISHNDPNKL